MPAKARKPKDDEDAVEAGASRDWSHPDGIPLSDVNVDDSYKGTVTNVGKYGVFVDFGATKDARLRIPIKLGRRMKKGMEIEGMNVVSCEPELGRVVMEVEEAALPELPPPPKRAQSAGGKARSRGAGGGDASARSGSRKPRKNYAHEGATPLEDLHEGDVHEGTVTNVSPSGVFVDIGAYRDVRLSIPASIGKRFRIGDVVQDVTLERIDLENMRLSATLPDPEAAVADLPPKEPKPKAKAKAKAKVSARARSASPKPRAKAKTKARARSTSPVKSKDTIPIERLSVGSVVDGVVTNCNKFGVFVNVGCSKDAKLEVSKSLAAEFHKGDEVYGMRIDVVDLEKNQIRCSLEDPVLSVEDGGGTASGRGGGRGRGGKAGAARQAASPKPKAKAKAKGGGKSRFSVGSIADGYVTNITPQGVFVDIGTGSDGMLKLPRSVAEEFEVGDEVVGMVVESVRQSGDSERIMLSLESPELDASSAPQARAAAKGRASSKAKAKAKAGRTGSASPVPAKAPQQAPRASAKAKAGSAKAKAKAGTRSSSASSPPAPKAKAKSGAKWGHDGAIAITDLEVGGEVDGVVTNAGNYGVFVDIGAVKDGRLNVSREDAKKFRKGDKIEGMVIERIDAASQQLGLVLPFELGDEPELDTEEDDSARRPKPRQRSRPAGGGRKG